VQLIARTLALQLGRPYVPLLMAGQTHRLTLKAKGRDVAVGMASDYMPLRDKFKNAYNSIEYFKSYVGSIEDEEVKARFERELLLKIETLQADTVGEYKEAYHDAFPNRETERAPLSPAAESTVASKV